MLIRVFILLRSDLDETSGVSFPTDVLKKNFISNIPCGVAINLFEEILEMVDSCNSRSDAIFFNVKGLMPDSTYYKKLI